MTAIVKTVILLQLCHGLVALAPVVQSAVEQRPAASYSVVLNVCVFLERNAVQLTANYDRLAAAIDMALGHVKEETLHDTGIALKKTYRDAGDNCDKATYIAAMAAMELFATGFQCHVFIGPGCVDSATDIYNIATFSNTPVFAIPAGGIVNSEAPRDLFPQLSRMSYQAVNIASLLVQLLKQLSIEHTYCLIHTSITVYRFVGDALYEQYRLKEPDLLRYSTFEYLEEEGLGYPDSALESYLRSAQRSSRTIILLTHGELTRRIMLMAQDFGMTNGDYLYLGVEPFESNSWGILTPAGHDGLELEARSAFASLLVVAVNDRKTAYWDSFAISFATLASSRAYNYNFTQDGNVLHIMNPMVAAYFDAIVVYASALRAVQKAGLDVTNPAFVLAALRNRTYHSPLTEEIIMDENGDRIISYVVQEILPNGQYDIIKSFSRKGGLVDHGNIHWHNGVPPSDIPFCGFLGNDPKCIPKTNVGLIIGVTLAALCFSGAVMFARVYMQRNKRRDPYWWRVLAEELDFTAEEAADEPAFPQLNSFGDGKSGRHHIGKTEYHGVHLAVVELPEKAYHVTTVLLKEMEDIRALSHPNLVRFVGLVLDEQNYCLYLLEESCEKDCLVKLMASETILLDDAFKTSFFKDIIEGMAFLHSNSIGPHGFLTSACCLVNSKFMVKIDDYGITQFRDSADLLPPKASDTADLDQPAYLWRAPEHLREAMPVKGSQKGDVYSFGIVMQEVICRSGPFLLPLGLLDVEYFVIKNIAMEVKRGTIPPFRPKVPSNACTPDMYAIMQSCLEEEPEDRPTFSSLRDTVKKFQKGGYSIVDHLLEKMEAYSQALELEVARKTEQFKAEKTRSDNLLKNMLPKATAEALTKGLTVPPESFTSVTIFFSDIVGFGELCSRISPLAVLEALNCLYQWSDEIMQQYDIYKVEAIDDIFMVASGLPVRNGNRHVTIMATLALHLKREVPSIKIPNQSAADLKIRIGMYSGPCVAGIVGLKMPRYCLFGDSVNTASRMQSHGEADKIHLSESTAQLLQEVGGFVVEKRGEMQIKGKGLMTTYWLNDSDADDKKPYKYYSNYYSDVQHS